MHMVIRAIVYAEDGLDALERAKSIFRNLCESDWAPFDYFVTFDEPGSVTSGKGRWGNIPPVVRASSPEGKKLIDEAVKFQKAEFNQDLKQLRKKILFPRKLLIEDRMWRYRCHCIHSFAGPNCWLYDNDGEAIVTKDHLKNVLNKWECLSEEHRLNQNLKIFVVPADVHY